ncbi:hypothetical protein B5M42_001070 [Paenibacillus athensensis]|uniref:Uncharacterized protein n=1 Tax=Paenibacillus athensensis TaxID=1967502 RepID=A0A4Y8Q809_9BACL|nr:hypothetical protein [Paenibacillus athensensis]MCD1257427.1 hypothetical protein [Paenibacillus athensensis]
MVGEFRYEIDNCPLIVYEPAIDFIERYLQQMDARTHSFCELTVGESACLQARGGASRMIVEYRIGEGEAFRHYVVGRKKSTLFPVKVRYSAGMIQAFTNELLTWEEALELFGAFMDHPQPSSAYLLRETFREQEL